MRKVRQHVEAALAVALAVISITVGLFFMLAVVAAPFVAVGLGIALAVKAFSWIVGWPA